MYNPIYKENDLILGTGKPIIVTGWTDRRQVAKHFSKDEYAAIGNLFDPDIGLDYLIANVLANPDVDSIQIYCDFRNELSRKSVTPLSYLFFKGYSKTPDYYLINGGGGGRISNIFTEEDIDTFRQISFQWSQSIRQLKDNLDYANLFTSNRIARIVELPVTVKDILPPGKLYNHCL